MSANAAFSWPIDVMLVVPKSMMMSGRAVFAAATADCTVEKVVETFTPRLTSLEMPEEPSRLCESIEDVPVSMTVSCDRAVEAPVETTVIALTAEETAEDTDVMTDLTLDIPTVAVDSDEEKLSQMLFSVETFAWVDVWVVFDWAVESSVAIEVTDESKVDSEVVALSAID